MHRYHYRTHGYRVGSEIEVPGWQLDDPAEPVDLHVVRRPVDRWDRGYAVLARSVRADRETTVVDRDGVTQVWFGQFGTIEIGPGAVLAADVGDESGLEPWLVAGAAIAVLMMMRGQLVLHATAVSMLGHGVNLVAPVEHGKSTAAALLVAGGAGLVAEDVVRCVRPAAAELGWTVAPGMGLLRLRRTVDELWPLFASNDLASSSDGRTLVRCSPADRAVVIRGNVFVTLDPAASAVELVDVAPPAAIAMLMGSLRVEGVLDDRLLDQQFGLVADLVDATWCSRLRLPWSGRLDAALAADVHAAIAVRLTADC